MHSLSWSPYLRMVAETVVMGQPLLLPLVAPTQRKAQLSVYLQAPADDLLGQFGIRGDGDVLLLHGHVDERLVGLDMTVVHSDALSQYLLHALLLDAVPNELVALLLVILPRGWRWLRGVGRGCQNGRCRRGG